MVHRSRQTAPRSRAPRREVHKIVVSVKGGGVKPDDVRALNHVREREKAELAPFHLVGAANAGNGEGRGISRLLLYTHPR